MPSIGQINIDFQVINSNDPAVLLVGDFSSWAHIENKPAVIEVIVPGASYPISFSFVKNSINALNGSNLNLGCGDCEGAYPDLPDGIYTITVIGSPDTFRKQRYYLKTDKTRLELDRLYTMIGLEYSIDNKEYIEALSKTEFYLRVAEAHTRRGYIGKAKRFFDEAQILIKRYKNCKNCY